MIPVIYVDQARFFEILTPMYFADDAICDLKLFSL